MSELPVRAIEDDMSVPYVWSPDLWDLPESKPAPARVLEETTGGSIGETGAYCPTFYDYLGNEWRGVITGNPTS